MGGGAHLRDQPVPKALHQSAAPRQVDGGIEVLADVRVSFSDAIDQSLQGRGGEWGEVLGSKQGMGSLLGGGQGWQERDGPKSALGKRKIGTEIK